MAGEADDTSWLDTEPAPAANDDWLRIEDGNAGKIAKPFQHLVDSCMRGTNRVMACDGQYLAYRPFNREFDKEVNPRTRERFNMFCEKGFYKHAGTYDEVQIYELLEGNPYRHERKQYVIGADYWKDIRTAAKAAYDRNWSDYHDIMGAIATALKGGNRDPLFARTMWDDAVNQVTVAIGQMGPGAPTDKEVNEGFVGIRRARGITGKSGTVVTLNSNSLQKVGFTKGAA